MEIAIIINGVETIIPDTVVSACIVAILISVFSVFVNAKAKKSKIDEPPSGFLNIVEFVVEFVEKTVAGNMGEKNLNMAPFVGALGFFLIASNLFGFTGFSAPTSDYSVTLTLALIAFCVIQYHKIKNEGGVINYLKSLAKPYALMAPINIISEIATPVSMSFRLFGNIMSGTLIMGMLYSAMGVFAPIVTVPLHFYFDIFVGILQAFIFVMLMMVFISNSMKNEN